MMRYQRSFISKAPGPTALMMLVAALVPRPVAALGQSDVALVAPIYVSAVPVPFEDEARAQRDAWRFQYADRLFTEHTRSFYSSDPLDTVRGFYAARIGEMQNGSLGYLRIPEGMRSDASRPGPNVYSVVLGRAENSELLGVELRTIAPRRVTPPNLPAVGPYFEKLIAAHAAGHGTRADVDRIIEEHRHLAWLFYPLTDERAENGERLAADQVVFRRCEAEQGGGMSPEELGAQMQAAAQRGDFATVRRLSQAARSAAGAGSMDAWVRCLGELERHGYRTLITIDVRHEGES